MYAGCVYVLFIVVYSIAKFISKTWDFITSKYCKDQQKSGVQNSK